MKRGFTSRLLCVVAALAVSFTLPGCKGSDGPVGAVGPAGQDGTNGKDGSPGAPGAPGGNSGVANFHGMAVVTAEDLAQGAPADPKFYANIAITGATADSAGVAAVTFTVKNGTTPVTGITAVSAGIFKLAPASGGRSFTRWVPYLYRPGRDVNAGYRESTTSTPVHGTLVDHGSGSYTYTFGTNLATATLPFDPSAVPTTTPGGLVGYDRTLTHRVSVYLGGHAGPTGEADFDFVPNGNVVTVRRDIVQTAACQKCHGANEFHGHGGDRITVEGCNACHAPDGWIRNSATADPVVAATSYESIAMQVMLHKIHAGRELQSAAGPDGLYFDDPTTIADESADNYSQQPNGPYRLGSLSATWRSAAFPAGLANCTVCHTGTGAQVDNWKTVPSREACGSCHDLVNFATGVGHEAQADDSLCAACHPATAPRTSATYRRSIAGAHDFMTSDPRNNPEFVVTVSVNTPTRGYFLAGEAPVITVKLSDAATGQDLDHTTILEDPTAEGCTVAAGATECTEARDGLFRSANMYVTGPRAKRLPVLSYAARAKVLSAATGPWDLSGAAGQQLRLVVDSGTFFVQFGHDGEDVNVPGDFTVTLPAAALVDGTFVSSTAATASEVAAWLNTVTYSYSGRPAGDPRTFLLKDRAIAYVDEQTGKLAIRSRGLASENPNIQIPDTAKGLNGIFTDTGVKVAGQASQLRQRTASTSNDPKLAWATDKLTYTLDPVDDLLPGTYMINVEFADRGNLTETNYKTPSIAVATFQVKQKAVEKPIAGNCTSCHWSTDAVGQGVGFVMDPRRHNKPFNAQALDQCGGCHDYASGEAIGATAAGGVGTGALTPTWSIGGGGGKPIGKRVHSVHNGAALNYPILTVDHEESVPGRGWRITYPQSVRNCESCHPAGTTTGTWATRPNRVACMGCHDSDVATAHMKVQVYDPTPVAPWSGDEEEACAACH